MRVKWYRVVVSEKFYEYMSAEWGLSAGIGIGATLQTNGSADHNNTGNRERDLIVTPGPN